MVSGEEADKFIGAWWKIILAGIAVATAVGAFTKPETGVLSGIVVILAIFMYLINRQLENHIRDCEGRKTKPTQKSKKGVANAERIITFIMILLILYLLITKAREQGLIHP